MPWTVINQWMALGLPRFAGDDIAYLPFSVAPVGQPSRVESSIAYAEPSDQADDAETQLATAFRARAADKLREKMPSSEAALWREHMSRRAKVISDYGGSRNHGDFDIIGRVLREPLIVQS